MSSQAETTPADKPADKPATDTPQQTPAPAQTKPIKKVKSKKDLKDDPSRFEAPGINFTAKLIGIDDVESARGDKMCQDAMTRLKMAVRQSGQHKQKIIINVSLDGIRIMDSRTQATNHTHAVHRISFISRDITDARAFGYIYGAGEGKHRFFAIKTEKAAEALVLSLRDLFQAVYEMKKREVEEAKHKKEEPATEETPTEKTDEAKEEPVYQVPSSKPVENGEEPTYQVPTNNEPVQQQQPEETADLLNLENELHSMEQRIEQIDTMEELFKELEAPPPSTAGSTPNSANSSSWANSLAGLAPPSQPQSQPVFSMGGSPFPPPNNQAFPPSNQAFPPAAQSQPFGAPAQQPGMFGAPNQQPGFGGGFPQQPGAQPAGASPFGGPFQQPPNVPPRTGMPGFPPAQPGGFPPAQPGGFPGTPFPGTQQQPGFPPVGGQPTVVVTPANDPFGAEPFGGGNTAFEEGVLTPARMEAPAEEEPAPTTKSADVFGDLVSLGGSKPQASPKEMFVDTKPKKSLNEMKGDRTPSPKPVSPSGFQASGSPGELDIGYSSPSNPPPASNAEPFGASTNNPFGSEDDPFANDPFASKTSTSAQPSTDAWAPSSSSNAQAPHIPSQDAQFGGSPFGDDDFNLPVPSGPPPPLPSGPPPPLPSGPPPPLPSNVCDETVEPQQLAPVIPPRPNITPPMNTHPTPPLPPRPQYNSSESLASVSSTNSHTESHSGQPHETPPPPPPRPNMGNSPTTVPRPRPNMGNSPTAVPRPRPRPRASTTTADKNFPSEDKVKRVNNNYIVSSEAQKPVTSPPACVENDRTKLETDCARVPQTKAAISDNRDSSAPTAARESRTTSVCSTDSSVTRRTHQGTSDIRPVSSGSSISDPFVDTDPFATDDPFKNSDPFANDPFAADPFTDPVYASPQSPPSSTEDPFTSVQSNPQVSADDTDPFSVFDKTFSSDMFKFDRSSSKKSKLKVSGQ